MIALLLTLSAALPDHPQSDAVASRRQAESAREVAAVQEATL
jgi:hypothetical protein